MAGRGCLSLLLPVRAAAPRALPLISEAEVHPKDRAALRKARAAAEGALASFRAQGSPDVAVSDLTSRLGELLQGLHRLAEDLGRARRFVERNDPDRLAKEKAELELKRMTASAGEILPLRKEADALGQREALAARVRGEIPGLEARLSAAGQELEAFRARVEARADADALGHEVAAYQQAAEAVRQQVAQVLAELR